MQKPSFAGTNNPSQPNPPSISETRKIQFSSSGERKRKSQDPSHCSLGKREIEGGKKPSSLPPTSTLSIHFSASERKRDKVAISAVPIPPPLTSRGREEWRDRSVWRTFLSHQRRILGIQEWRKRGGTFQVLPIARSVRFGVPQGFELSVEEIEERGGVCRFQCKARKNPGITSMAGES